jgi:hypothetical protein
MGGEGKCMVFGGANAREIEMGEGERRGDKWWAAFFDSCGQ